MDSTLWAAFAACLLVGLAAPWGFQVLMKKVFHRQLSYLASFLILLVASMVLSAILTHFFPSAY